LPSFSFVNKQTNKQTQKVFLLEDNGFGDTFEAEDVIISTRTDENKKGADQKRETDAGLPEFSWYKHTQLEKI
jgi:hypothetical protein